MPQTYSEAHTRALHYASLEEIDLFKRSKLDVTRVTKPLNDKRDKNDDDVNSDKKKKNKEKYGRFGSKFHKYTTLKALREQILMSKSSRDQSSKPMDQEDVKAIRVLHYIY